MLYEFLYPLREYFFGFNVVKYITFRAAMASISAFVISVSLGPWLIRFLRDWNIRHSVVRQGFEEISERHRHKEEIPTMGGLLIIGSILISCLLWGSLNNRFLWIALGVMTALGGIGMIDDLIKLLKDDSRGLQAATKLSGQLILGLLVGFLLYSTQQWEELHIPFIKNAILPLGILYVPFVCLVLAGSSNAVNLSDGLDGLAIGCMTFMALTYAIFSYITGHALFSQYLYLPFIAGSGELTVFCSAVMGACLGFLWFNSHPASIFMGDTGSLALGGAIGIVGILIKKELLLLIVGGVFVIEALSVILQVTSFKTRQKRIFLMTPLHHHFQLKGWPESKIVIRFWILSVIFALMGLAALKLR
jgi:phospho-N-acetylmuramoyl-pentapeptide-transferase